MNHGEIMDLVHAGFTPDQIMTLTTSGTIPSAPESVPEVTTPPASGPSESPIKEEAPAPDPAPDASSQGDPGQDPAPDPLDEIRETVRKLQAENEDLKKQIQTANIRDRTMSTPAVPDASATLAEIIRPTFHNNVESNH